MYFFFFIVDDDEHSFLALVFDTIFLERMTSEISRYAQNSIQRKDSKQILENLLDHFKEE